MSETMEVVDEREKKKKKETNKQTNKQRQKRTRKKRSYSERMRAKWFCCAFKWRFFQLICKAFLIFTSNLELALSIISRQRELYESKDAAVECRCLKMRLVMLYNMFLNPSFKMTTSFTNIARTTANTSKFIY